MLLFPTEVSILFNGTNVYATSSLNVALPETVVIVPAATTLETKNVAIYAGTVGTVVATLKQDGVALANKTVTVLIDGETAAILTTDENGTINAALKILLLASTVL